jgi:hypothetical protein
MLTIYCSLFFTKRLLFASLPIFYRSGALRPGPAYRWAFWTLRSGAPSEKIEIYAKILPPAVKNGNFFASGSRKCKKVPPPAVKNAKIFISSCKNCKFFPSDSIKC